MNNENQGQIKFWRKSHIDLDRTVPTLTVTDSVATNTGQDYIDLIRNRSNNSGWLTTNSDDTANTEILVDLVDVLNVDMVGLIRHNFKDFTIEYFDEDLLSYETFESFTDNTESSNISESATTISTSKIKITINSTQVADADKVLRQLVITEKLLTGQFNGYPQIKKPTTSFNKKVNRLLGGAVNVVEKRGAFSCSLDVRLLSNDEDLDIIEQIYFQREGILMLLSGNKEDQFLNRRVGYRNEDIVLVRPTNELELPYFQGIYKNGIVIKMRLEQSVF